jgi:drug/metabolite transporter (DMT)-like permease
MSQTVPIRVYVMLLLGMMSISFAPILVRLAQGEAVPSLLIAASRLTLAALALTPIVLRQHWERIRRLTRRDLAFALLSGVFLALHFASWVTSLEYTSVLISVVFVTSSPLWVAILEFIFLKVKLPRQVIIGLVIAIVGGLLIGLAGQFANNETVNINQEREFIGGLLSLIGAVAMAVYLIIGRNLQRDDPRGKREKLSVIPYIWLVYGTAGLILLVWSLAIGIPLTGYSNSAYLWLIAMAAFPQLVGHSSLNYAVGYLPATIVSMVTQLEPIGSAILAYILFAELPLPLQIFGSLVIIFGVMLANYRRPSCKIRQSESA